MKKNKLWKKNQAYALCCTFCTPLQFVYFVLQNQIMHMGARWDERQKGKRGAKNEWAKVIESETNCRTCRPPACWQLSAPFSHVTDVTRFSPSTAAFSRTLSKLLDTFNYGNWLTLWWVAMKKGKKSYKYAGMMKMRSISKAVR